MNATDVDIIDGEAYQISCDNMDYFCRFANEGTG